MAGIYSPPRFFGSSGTPRFLAAPGQGTGFGSSGLPAPSLAGARGGMARRGFGRGIGAGGYLGSGGMSRGMGGGGAGRTSDLYGGYGQGYAPQMFNPFLGWF